jgi:glycosyltransferase involved in cell wall biosynthesis
MHKENPQVSIIVRTKDRPALLKRAIKSIAAQTYCPIEVVLVNDGGCDLDVEELRRILGDAALNYIRLDENRGRARAGNAGIENALGDYIGFLDDDDEFYPEHVMELISFLKQSDYKVAYTDSLSTYKGYDSDEHVISDSTRELIFFHDFNYGLLLFENYIPFHCLLFTREILANSKGFDPLFDLYEDWDLLIRIGEAHPFYHLKKTTVRYNYWSAELQISQRNRNAELLRDSYLKVLSKHIGKITPIRVHEYMSQCLSERLLLKQLEYKIEVLTDEQIKRLEAEVHDKNAQIENLFDIVRSKDYLITAMRNTLGWRILEKYRKVRGALFTPGLPMHTQKLLIKGLKVLKDQGMKAALQKANKKLLLFKSIRKPRQQVDFGSISVATAGTEIIHESLKAKVSVIIPTKNAGQEFEYSLKRISRQAGIQEIELIIIDSGSTDGTLNICNLYTNKVYEIPPGDFHHSRTRNFGVNKATGSFIVFTVQDAIPAGNYWLYKLVFPLYEGKVSAVSARQIPRSDADLFAVWSYYNHNIEYLRSDKDRISASVPEAFDALSIQKKRSLAGLDNVCLCISKEIIREYQFRSDYAEDLELGVRLLKNDHELMFQSSNAVIHSHNRDAGYYLKRSYMDTVSLSEILNITREDNPQEKALEVISHCFGSFKNSLARLIQENGFRGNPHTFVKSLSEMIQNTRYNVDSSTPFCSGENPLEAYFQNIPQVNHQDIGPSMYVSLDEHLNRFARYMATYADFQDINEDVIDSLHKVFSIVAGNYLGSYSRECIQSLYGGI